MFSKNPSTPRLFGTSGIRGVVGKELSYELLWNVGRAIATSLNLPARAIISTDSRQSRNSVKAKVVSGLLAGGVDVIDAGMLPTPILAWATVDMGMDMGIVITASHNPPEYNGVRLFTGEGIGYSTRQENEIERIYAEKIFVNGVSANFIGSDVMSFLPYTREAVYIEDGEVVVITAKTYQIFDFEHREKKERLLR